MAQKSLDCRKSLDAIVEDTLYRIRDDRRSAPADVATLLQSIEENFGDYRFTAAELQRAHQPDERTLGRFRGYLGVGVGTYLHNRRHEAALNMLRESREPIAAVASRLGYDDPDVFSKWFHRRSGLRPREVRRAAEEEALPQAAPGVDVVFWRRALAGDVEPEAAVRLLGFLFRRYATVLQKPTDEGHGSAPATGDAS